MINKRINGVPYFGRMPLYFLENNPFLMLKDLIGTALSKFPDHIPIVYKLSILITSLVVFCMTALGVSIVYNQSRHLRAQIDDLGRTVVNQMAHTAAEPLMADDRLTLEVLTNSLVSGEIVIGTEILSPDGESLVSAGITPFDEINSVLKTPAGEVMRGEKVQNFWRWKLNLPKKKSINAVSFIHPIVFQNVTAGFAVVSFSQEAMDRSLEHAIESIIIATLIIVVMGILMAYMLSHSISRPVTHFMKAIRAFDEGSFDFRFDERRKDEVGQLMCSFNKMAEGMVKKNQVESALDRYLSPGVAKKVMSNLESVKLGGMRIEGTVVFADIVGFTKISEKLNPEDLATLLNHYFSIITHACELNFGNVDKYMGDCAMLLFGVPEPDTKHRLHGAICALVISEVIAHENRIRQAKGLFPVHFRIGINTGKMLAGNMGSKSRMEYTVVGDSVNLASRLCSVAEVGKIVIPRRFFLHEEVNSKIIATQHKSIRLRGVKSEVMTYFLDDVIEELKPQVKKQVKTIIS